MVASVNQYPLSPDFFWFVRSGAITRSPDLEMSLFQALPDQQNRGARPLAGRMRPRTLDGRCRIILTLGIP